MPGLRRDNVGVAGRDEEDAVQSKDGRLADDLGCCGDDLDCCDVILSCLGDSWMTLPLIIYSLKK